MLPQVVDELFQERPGKAQPRLTTHAAIVRRSQQIGNSQMRKSSDQIFHLLSRTYQCCAPQLLMPGARQFSRFIHEA